MKSDTYSSHPELVEGWRGGILEWSGSLIGVIDLRNFRFYHQNYERSRLSI